MGTLPLVLWRGPSAILALVIIMTVSVAATAHAQNAGQARRLALVIGNSEYRIIEKLKNPKNDATDIAAKLRSLRFMVTLVIDADRSTFDRELKQFTANVGARDVALLFYAGHGITVNGESFLLPVDVPDYVQLPDGALQAQPVDSMIRMSSVLAPMQAARLGIVFLDACRNGLQEGGRGLGLRISEASTQRSVSIARGTMSLPIQPTPHSAGVFRAYATQLDNAADDGKGRNSPFTTALLRHISTPGISIQELMIRVRRDVMRDTQNKQIPWEEAALNEGFAFVEPVSAPAATSSSGSSGSAPKPSGGDSRPATKAAPPAPQRNQLPPGVGVGVGMGL